MWRTAPTEATPGATARHPPETTPHPPASISTNQCVQDPETPRYKADWEIPGGAVEADESPRAATIRELGEELGLVVTPGWLLVVDWVPPREGRTEGLMMLFDGGVLTPEQSDSIRLPPEELRSWAWCDQQQAEQRLSALLARRVAAALEARTDGGTAYLENGYA